ncbi:DUF4269 domain-containing protein [Flavobacterium supellecticarium]|uniref:DUF4269 domain-containing protein n=1 Tax=Flavobacterium supellecticarium TaxID=2565924 RepID=A0A4S3ZQJ8_9FLAO|nr:DUF4269 domain-containing protein [Flavobacterium supellecticarium]THF47847.1 DUF4269 domain-containing protein [Flavobacterium supellecticarium]
MSVFDTLDYLKKGNALQQKSYDLLTKHAILELLSDFDPILVGTIPIAIAIESSDLDIACYWKDKNGFIATLHKAFSGYPDYSCQELDHGAMEAIVANFSIDGIAIEIFGQNIPTREQNGYRHMLIEHRILQERGAVFREAVIALKKSGIKTEPAFAQLLQIEGDPYLGLLEYKKA